MHRKGSNRVAAAVATAAIMVVAGCGSSSHRSATGANAPPAGSNPGQTTGITASTVTIGQIATLSGPIPGGAQGAVDGLKAYVAYINSQGGVDGRRLEVVVKDDALNCLNDSQFVQSLAQSVFASVGTFALLDACEQRPLSAAPTFPDIQAYVLDSALLSLPNVTAPQPAPYGYQTAGALWVKERYPRAITHTAQLYIAASQTSANNIRLTYESLGYKYVYSRGIGLTETNFTSDVLRMKASGVQVVDLGSVDEQVASDFLRDAAQQGFHPLAVISAVAYDPNLFADVGPINVNDLYMPLSYPMFLGQDLTTNPELATMTTWMHKVHPGAVPDLYAVDAWAAGALFVQALRSAGPHPTRSGLLAALSRITSFNDHGLIPTADPGTKQASTCMVIIGVQGNHFVRLDPPGKGFECNGTYHHLTPAEAASGKA